MSIHIFLFSETLMRGIICLKVPGLQRMPRQSYQNRQGIAVRVLRRHNVLCHTTWHSHIGSWPALNGISSPLKTKIVLVTFYVLITTADSFQRKELHLCSSQNYSFICLVVVISMLNAQGSAATTRTFTPTNACACTQNQPFSWINFDKRQNVNLFWTYTFQEMLRRISIVRNCDQESF